jgi:hypothetical protein
MRYHFPESVCNQHGDSLRDQAFLLISQSDAKSGPAVAARHESTIKQRLEGITLSASNHLASNGERPLVAWLLLA